MKLKLLAAVLLCCEPLGSVFAAGPGAAAATGAATSSGAIGAGGTGGNGTSNTGTSTGAATRSSAVGAGGTGTNSSTLNGTFRGTSFFGPITTGKLTGSATGNGKGTAYSVLGIETDTVADPAAGFVPFNYHGAAGYPFSGVWGGFGGSAPSVGSPVPRGVASRAAAVRAAAPPPMMSLVSNRFPARLSVQLPTSGTIWTNGTLAEGKPRSDWVLISPDLGPGQEFKFNVTARWEADGKTFESKREVVVAGGTRSQVTVLTGTEVESGSLSQK